MVYLAYKTLTEIQTTLAGKVQILCYTFKHNANKNHFVWIITFGDFMLGHLILQFLSTPEFLVLKNLITFL